MTDTTLPAASTVAATHPGRRHEHHVPGTVSGLTATGGLAVVELSWRSYRPRHGQLVDHYEVYVSERAGRAGGLAGTATLLGRTLYPHFTHRVGPEPRTRYYSVVAVVDSGARTRSARPVAAVNARSVAAGRAVAQVGEFDHKGLEFALSPDQSASYRTAFPTGVNYRYGSSTPGRDWCYLHPGPLDAWAGRKEHTFTLRFDLSLAPKDDLACALWLIDSHATAAGGAEVTLNDSPVRTLEFRGGATRGSVEGDAARPGTALKPSYYEFPVAAGLFRAGENVLKVRKTSGSWIAYDALGIFARE
ncbi:polysaccharide lyase family protein [Streptomyces aureocirculatus]|uniref:polysaccharide lyase family protein n=1 Tax=Streptomyces aureocirculatus TaxID=67275 RepID=UPI00099CBEE9|nr:polysaccharide lyase family protein [Streptomyces aureocirculatus]